MIDGFIRGVLQVRGAEAVLLVVSQVAAQGDGPFEQRVIRVGLNLAGREDPAATAKTYSEITAGAVPPEWLKGHLDLLAGLWRNEDERAALEWVITEAPSEERSAALIETIGTWANRDFDRAWAWFDKERGPFDINDSAVLDPTDSDLLSGLVRRLARTSPAEAASWSARIRPGAPRDLMLQRIVRFWTPQDKPAVAAWLDSLAIDPATRASLTEMMNKIEGP